MATIESVATLAAEVESMKTILSTKIGANDDIMVAMDRSWWRRLLSDMWCLLHAGLFMLVGNSDTAV